jgi:hypothetical protein
MNKVVYIGLGIISLAVFYKLIEMKRFIGKNEAIKILNAHEKVGDLKIDLKYAYQEQMAIKNEMNNIVPKRLKTKLKAIQKKISQLQIQLSTKQTEKQEVEKSIRNSVPVDMYKKLKNVQLEIKEMKKQLNLHYEILRPYVTNMGIV